MTTIATLGSTITTVTARAVINIRIALTAIATIFAVRIR